MILGLLVQASLVTAGTDVAPEIGDAIIERTEQAEVVKTHIPERDMCHHSMVIMKSGP